MTPSVSWDWVALTMRNHYYVCTPDSMIAYSCQAQSGARSFLLPGSRRPLRARVRLTLSGLDSLTNAPDQKRQPRAKQHQAAEGADEADCRYPPTLAVAALAVQREGGESIWPRP